MGFLPSKQVLPVYSASGLVTKVRKETGRSSGYHVLNSGPGEDYLVDEAVAQAIGFDIAPSRDFYVAASEDADPFLWPVRTTQSNGKPNKTVSSAAKTVTTATGAWSQVEYDRSSRTYTAAPVYRPIPEPNWPDESVDELVEAAFTDRKITTLDHPAIAKARAKASR